MLLSLELVLTGILLQIWENYVEGEEVSNGSAPVESKQKEVIKVL